MNKRRRSLKVSGFGFKLICKELGASLTHFVVWYFLEEFLQGFFQFVIYLEKLPFLYDFKDSLTVGAITDLQKSLAQIPDGFRMRVVVQILVVVYDLWIQEKATSRLFSGQPISMDLAMYLSKIELATEILLPLKLYNALMHTS